MRRLKPSSSFLQCSRYRFQKLVLIFVLLFFALFHGLEYNRLSSDSRESPNKVVRCHLKNSRTLKLLTTSGGKPSRNRSESLSVEELKKLGEEMFDDPDRPWRQTFFQFIAKHPAGTFHHASAGEGVVFVYSRDGDKGLWYLPGSGVGPLSVAGRQIMKEAIEAGH